MKNRIKTFLKTNSFVYNIYYIFFSFLLRFMGLFIRINKKTILINSFGGKKYDDSPKAIYEYMINSKKYDDYEIYWSLDDVSINIPGHAKIVKNDSLKYFIIALKSQYWISNSSIERGLRFKKKKTIYINTWHGSALKKMGIDTKEENFRFNFSKYNYMYAQSNYDIDIFSHAYELPREIFKLVGLPRNDELAHISKNEIKEIKEKLNLPLDKKILIYAPTFREYERDEFGCVIKPPIDLNEWRKKLEKEYILIFRAHYEVNKVLNIKDDEFVYNFTSYPNLNELLKISDVLISDYSSIMFDYSITGRPIFSYAYDLRKYEEKRGLYLNLEQELPNGYFKDEDELLNNIVNIDFKVQSDKTNKFRKKYVEEYGNASQYIDEIILK